MDIQVRYFTLYVPPTLLLGTLPAKMLPEPITSTQHHLTRGRAKESLIFDTAQWNAWSDITGVRPFNETLDSNLTHDLHPPYLGE